MNGAMVRIEDVHKRFGRLEVLKGVSFDVARGEVVVILGPSGSGKSTLLRLISHLDDLDRGRIYVDGRLVGYEERGGKLKKLSDAQASLARADVGMVFQRFNLFPHLDALANVNCAPMHVRGISKRRALERGAELLKQVGLGDKLHAYPSQLSGGQQQRVAIARSLANDPLVILADEPTGNLDSATEDEILGILKRLHREGKTIIMVTHEDRIAHITERVIRLRDGSVISDRSERGGSVEDLAADSAPSLAAPGGSG